MDLFQYHADAVKFRVAKSTENYLIQVKCMYLYIISLHLLQYMLPLS